MQCFEDSDDHLIEFSDKSCCGQRAALMVPARSRVGFFDGGRMKGEWGSAHSRADKSRRRASSSETGLTAPESMSAMRRATSSSQAASTDSSCMSSRLSMRESGARHPRGFAIVCYHDSIRDMAQLIVRKLENEVKDKLSRRAKRHGRSVEEEVREILRDATKREGKTSRLLGTEIARLFHRAGLKPGEEIRELRQILIQPVDFEE